MIASRYTRGGATYEKWTRRFLSELLNLFMRRSLVPVRDLSSGFRRYLLEVLPGCTARGHNLELLEEILVKACAQGLSMYEVPFTYFPRESGSSRASLLRLDLMRFTFKPGHSYNSINSGPLPRARAF